MPVGRIETFASQRRAALFHVAVVHAKRHQDFAHTREALRSVGRRPQIRFGDDFDERDPAAIEVERGGAVGVGLAVVQRFAGVLLHVDPRDADHRCPGACPQFEPAAGRDRLLVLRNLVPLRQVGIEVVLAREDRSRLDRATEREPRADCQFDSPPVQYR